MDENNVKKKKKRKKRERKTTKQKAQSKEANKSLREIKSAHKDQDLTITYLPVYYA